MMDSWILETMRQIGRVLNESTHLILHQSEEIKRLAEQLLALVEEMDDERPRWMLPVGTEEYPPDTWYSASMHDLTGRRNNGYRHTGVDLNLDVAPWGDVDRGMPVWSVADGVVDQVGRSGGWLGVVVIEHSHAGAPLYARYAHLGEIAVSTGQAVLAGDLIGDIGNYLSGGDHLHFDMATEWFMWREWLSGRDWVDPVDVLKAHVDPEAVEAMIRRGD